MTEYRTRDRVRATLCRLISTLRRPIELSCRRTNAYVHGARGDTETEHCYKKKKKNDIIVI